MLIFPGAIRRMICPASNMKMLLCRNRTGLPQIASLGWRHVGMPCPPQVLGRPANCSKEFDADQLSRSPNNSAPMCGAVRDYQQCKLCRKLERADCLQRGPSLGLVTNETCNREPAKLYASYLQTVSIRVFARCVIAFLNASSVSNGHRVVDFLIRRRRDVNPRVRLARRPEPSPIGGLLA